MLASSSESVVFSCWEVICGVSGCHSGASPKVKVAEVMVCRWVEAVLRVVHGEQGIIFIYEASGTSLSERESPSLVPWKIYILERNFQIKLFEWYFSCDGRCLC